MKHIRLTFNSSTNFTLPIGVYRVLQGDAYYYGFIKNGKANISGFLNNLIPALSDYEKNLFNELLEYNNKDEGAARMCARSIHNVYLRPFLFHYDGVINVPFRISQDKYNDFWEIHDERLAFYDTDFTGYIRTLLSEYASKSFTQREYLYAYKRIIILREAITKRKICKFYAEEATFEFAPVFIEPSPIYPHNYIAGVDIQGQPQIIRLSETIKISIQKQTLLVTEEMCELLFDALNAIYEEESKECLD